MIRSSRGLFLAAVAVSLSVAGCGEGFVFQWAANPAQATLFALDRAELSRPSGFNMRDRRAVVIEDPLTEGSWDFVVDRQGGVMVLIPPSVLGVPTRAGIAVFEGMEFDDVRIAPGDTAAYATGAPVPIVDGNIYVVRTHQQANVFGENCFFFGKVDPLEIDATNGVFRFQHDTSPECNSRRLVPPD